MSTHPLQRTGHALSHILLLVIRLYWGILLVLAGITKLAHFSDVTAFFTTLHMPLPAFSVALAAVIEILGGLSLVLGLFSRWFALLLIAFFITAYLVAHRHAVVSLLSHPGLFFAQPPFLFLSTSLLVFCFGPGKISLDALIEKKKR